CDSVRLTTGRDDPPDAAVNLGRTRLRTSCGGTDHPLDVTAAASRATPTEASAQQRGQLGETADDGHPLAGGLGTLLVGGESSAIDPHPEQSGAGGADRIRVQPIADVASLRRLDAEVASGEPEDAGVGLRHPHLATRGEVAERDERIQSGSDDLGGLEGEVA